MIRGTLLVAVLVLAGCSSSGGGGGSRGAQRLPNGAAQTEGSVTTKDGSFVRYPDGAVVRVTDVEKVAGARCYKYKPTDTCLLVEVRLQNTGSAPINFLEDDSPSIDLYYGSNQYQAEDSTFAGDRDAILFPRRCVPGSSVTAGRIFRVPTAQLGEMAVQFQSWLAGERHYTPYEFTDVQTLLH